MSAQFMKSVTSAAAGWRWGLQRAYRNHGVLGTAGLILRKAIQNVTPSRHQADPGGIEFDRRFDVDTRGNIALGRMSIKSANKAFGSRHQPVDPEMFKAL